MQCMLLGNVSPYSSECLVFPIPTLLLGTRRITPLVSSETGFYAGCLA